MNAKFCFECIGFRDARIFSDDHLSLRSLILDLAAYNQQLDINRDCEAETQQAEYLMINFSAHNSKYMDLIITKIRDKSLICKTIHNRLNSLSWVLHHQVSIYKLFSRIFASSEFF